MKGNTHTHRDRLRSSPEPIQSQEESKTGPTESERSAQWRRNTEEEEIWDRRDLQGVSKKKAQLFQIFAHVLLVWIAYNGLIFLADEKVT